MGFVTVKGLKGKVYIPDMKSWNKKKNPCPDCYSCNMCSDDRCAVCLASKKCVSTGHCKHKTSPEA